MNNEESVGCYLFCVYQGEQDAEYGEATMSGVSSKVRTITHNGLSMVAADLPVKIYAPKKDDLLAHQEVINQVMKEHSVIPMSYGTVLSSEEDVKLLMEKIEPQLKETFPKIENKIEVGLKVIAKKDWLAERVHKDPQLNKLNQVTAKDSYYRQIEAGEKAKNFIHSLRTEYETKLASPLEKLSVSTKLNEPVSERMLMNASFLIEKSMEEEFDKKVNELYEELSDQVDFNYSGPWPAYNFIELKFKAEGAV